MLKLPDKGFKKMIKVFQKTIRNSIVVNEKNRKPW
jgi:hypothetical protein